MKTSSTNQRIREWLSIAGAVAIGPLALTYGYSRGLMFGVAAAFYFFVCAMIVPLLTYAGGRLKFIVWQLAVLDLALSVVGDDLRVGMSMHGREIFSVAYFLGFWALCSPRPCPSILFCGPCPDAGGTSSAP